MRTVQSPSGAREDWCHESFGKSLWSEDARQPFPLEPAHRSIVDRPDDAVSLGFLEMRLA